MNDWTLLGLCMGIGLLLGLVLALLLRFRFQRTTQRVAGTMVSLTWHYHLAGTVFFAAMAFISWHNNSPAFAVFFALGSAFYSYVTIAAIIRERAQFGSRHLLIAVTCVAVLAACYHWFGFAVVVVVLIVADAVILGLAVRAWKRSGQNELPSEAE
ncbi:hypothetical protein [Aeoliella sp.]|uniref:hypothetical protein n=1 Tax=Aeoliella sp. TaxID=2795800 RepID=UPI003CCB807F